MIIKEHDWIVTTTGEHSCYMECTGCNRAIQIENDENMNVMLSTERFWNANIKAFDSISIDCNEEVIKKVLNE